MRVMDHLKDRIEEIGQLYKESIMNGEAPVPENVARDAQVCAIFSEVISLKVTDLNEVSQDV